VSAVNIIDSIRELLFEQSSYYNIISSKIINEVLKTLPKYQHS